MGTSRSKKLARHEQDEYTRKALLGDHIPEDNHDYRVNRLTFTIYVGGDPDSKDDDGDDPGVDHKMADRFEINLGMLSAIDTTRPILATMAGDGGHWDEGMQMFGAILTCPNPVTVFAVKGAWSMASIIPLAADRFVIRPPAQYMFHMGSWGFYGTEQEAETANTQRKRVNERMFMIYIARLKSQGMHKDWDEKQIREMLDEKIKKHVDVWLSADEAKQWGFADDVFDGNWDALRATKQNVERRKLMMTTLRKKIKLPIF